MQQPPLQPPSFTHVPKPACSCANVPEFYPFLPGFSTLVCARNRPWVRCCCVLSPYTPSPFSAAVLFDGPKLHVFLFSSSASLVHRVKGQNKPAFPENRPAPAAYRKRHARKPGEERRSLQSNFSLAARSLPVPQHRFGGSLRDVPAPAPHRGCQHSHGSRQGKVFAPAVCPGLLGKHKLPSPALRKPLAGRQAGASLSCPAPLAEPAPSAHRGRHPLPR